ncbi:MAG TPA: TIM-barrel domain-containing protein [Actinophytocola sp.]|uniref:TIM-barrel domain-containing protein n=1 Tax=Actinophytocola sp. TaxID=1872138 RepID=UPI002DDCC7D3|nr:TIM-barrel domain-containing protein [Actinophytocola sp.]HEV2781597.1 TIM-barrel domain-containing protein [Actinophytocola sp.]
MIRPRGWRPALVGVAALSILASVSSGLPAAAAAPEQVEGVESLRWTVDRAPFGLTFLRGGRPLVGHAPEQAAGPGGRMAYALADGSTHRLTDLIDRRGDSRSTTYTVATDEPDRRAQVVVRRTPRGLRVEWTFQPPTGVAQVYEALTGDDGEHFLGGGANFLYTDLRHRVLLNKVRFTGAGTLNRCNSGAAPSPFFISSRGYAIFPHTNAIGRLAFPNAVDDPPHCVTTPPPCPVQLGVPDRIQLCFKASRLDYEVYAGSPAEVVRSYSALAGRPKLPPVRQLELTFWRDINPGGQQQVLDDVAQLQSRGFPVKTVWIDNPWEINTANDVPGTPPTHGGACNGTLRFDPQQFPEPQAMIDELHRRGVRLGLWISSFVRPVAANVACPDAGYPPGSFVADTGRTDRFDIDFTNPVARAHFEAKLSALFTMGVDFVKGDRGDETDFENARFAAGPGADFHNVYPVLYAESTANALRRVWGDEYTMLFRAGYTGSPSVLHGFWGADANDTFEGLRLSVRRGMNSWLSGHPVWGTDTGGYANGGNPEAPSPTLFTRWAQFSAVSPVFEVGGQGKNAQPWTYDEATVRRFRDAVRLHEAITPYLYALARHSARTGEPITRPLGFDFPADDRAWAADQHMMIGRHLLAVPVTADRAEADGAAGLPTPVDVYLPAGRWLDVFAGRIVQGGQQLVRAATLDEFPLYLRLDGLDAATAGTLTELRERTWG